MKSLRISLAFIVVVTLCEGLPLGDSLTRFDEELNEQMGKDLDGMSVAMNAKSSESADVGTTENKPSIVESRSKQGESKQQENKPASQASLYESKKEDDVMEKRPQQAKGELEVPSNEESTIEESSREDEKIHGKNSEQRNENQKDNVVEKDGENENDSDAKNDGELKRKTEEKDDSKEDEIDEAQKQEDEQKDNEDEQKDNENEQKDNENGQKDKEEGQKDNEEGQKDNEDRRKDNENVEEKESKNEKNEKQRKLTGQQLKNEKAMNAKRLRNFFDIYPYPLWPIDYGLTYPMQYPGYPLYPIFVVPKPDDEEDKDKEEEKPEANNEKGSKRHFLYGSPSLYRNGYGYGRRYGYLNGPHAFPVY